MALGELSQTLPTLPVPEDGGTVEIKRLPSDMPSFELGPPHSCPHSLDDEAALQFGDGADDDDYRPAQRAAGVDLFAEADELDVEPVQLVQDFEEVLNRPGDPVRSPHQDNVELTSTGIPHHGIELYRRAFAPEILSVLLDDPIAALSGHLVEVVHLSLGVLIEG